MSNVTTANDSTAKHDTEAATDFIEKMGLVTEAEGLPRIAGRMFGFLLVDGGPCTFDDFAERLQISRGSVSTNTRLLESLGVIERFTRPGERQVYFRLTEDPFGRILERAVERMRRIREVVADARDTLSGDMAAARERLSMMQEFYEFAIESTEANLDAWLRRND